MSAPSEATHEVRWPLMDGRCSRPGCDRTCAIPDVAESAPSEAEAFAEVLAAQLVDEYGEDRATWTELGSTKRIVAALLASPTMAERDARVRAEALREAADEVERLARALPATMTPADESVAEWLRDRADQQGRA